MSTIVEPKLNSPNNSPRFFLIPMNSLFLIDVKFLSNNSKFILEFLLFVIKSLLEKLSLQPN